MSQRSQRRKKRGVRSVPRRFLLIALLAVIGIAAALTYARTVRSRAPAPPDLARLGPLAPEVLDVVRLAAESVSQDPRDGARWGRFAMVCEANGLVGAARDAYAAAATLQRSEPKWPFHLATVEERLGQTDLAVRDMRRAIDAAPGYAPAYWHLGLWLLDANQMDEAERAFSRATEIDANDRAGWIGLARVYLQRGDNARAADLLERVGRASTPDRYALQLLGTAYRRLGRSDEAETALKVGSTGGPQWTDPWTEEMLTFRRGYAVLLKEATAHIVAGELEPAIRILEQLREQRPDDIVLLAHLGQVYVAAGRDQDGVKLLRQVILRDPDRFEAFVDLATGYMHQNDLTRARAAVERALSLNSSYGPAYETLGLIEWRGGDQRSAVASLETAARLDPRNVRALVWLGMVQTNLGRTSEAAAAFQRAVRTDPTEVDGWIGLANAEMSRRDLPAAAKALQQAEQLQRDRPTVRETAERLRSLQAAGAHRNQ